MRLLAPLVVVALVLLGIVAFDESAPEADLVFVNQGEIFTLDPQRMSYIADMRMAHALYEGLVRWDNHDFTIQPAAAALPELSEDGRTYTFRIAPDARWSNGDPVTAHDFLYSWQRALLPDSAADYTNLFFAIEGAEALFAWRQDQVRAFAADPFADDAGTNAVRAFVDRLDELLSSDDLPDAVASPPDRAGIARELAQLRAMASGADAAAGLVAELATASACRSWFDALAEPSSRAAEAAWMWKRLESRFASEVGLSAPDDRTIRIVLRRPVPYFLDLLCFPVFFPVHRPTVEGWPRTRHVEGWHRVPLPGLEERRLVELDPATGRQRQRHEWARPGFHVGNGPYVLTQWRYKRDLRLDRNAAFHRPELLRNDSVLALTIEDSNTSVLAFASGQVDWLVDASTEYQADMLAQRRRYEERHEEDLARMRRDGLTLDEALALLPEPGPDERRDIHVFPTFGVEFFSFNCRPQLADGRDNPFAVASVRRAFTAATDRERIVRDVTLLNEPVVTSLIPPGSIPGYAGAEGVGFDRDVARRELTSAGWTDRDGDGFVEDASGDPFPVVEILYTTNLPRYKWIAIDLKAQWERALGVRCELRGVETKFYKEDVKQGKFMVARGRWYGDYGDPTTFLELCRSTDGNNDRGYASPRVDAMLDEAARERDPRRRLEILAECERHLFAEEVPMLVICQLVQVYMYEPGRVTGLSQHPRLTQYLWQIKAHDETGGGG